ncbi:MAG: Ig-like domain repeat protein, partial [Candidatus Riflebacteria bacterium]|nr:Ig-like domain repeat protein [Candidatus Riflebacteria bacterium]
DTVAPVAVACSDIGAVNNDPDEQYSSDAQIYFYFTPTDERSGVGDVQIQISTAADISGLVAEPWVGPTSPYLFPDGEAMKTYYARVRVKDKAGNVGEWGSWSNGIMVVLSGAVTPPNAPTIAKVADKNAVPGVPLPINITSSIKVEGMSESLNLISVYVDNVYKQSVISDSNGNFQTFISLTTGTHALKVRAHNGFAESAFSNTITIVVDQTKPGISRVVYDSSGFTRGGQYFGTTASDHNLATFDFYLSDGGGGGFDISSFNAVMTEIEDDGDLVSAVAPYKNPVTSSVEVIAADRVRLLPDGAWKNCLQTGHRYRMAYEVSDFAGNKTTATFDFVIDNTKPGKAAEVPVDTVPLSCNIKNIYVYDYEKYPSGYPPAAALVPYKWDASANAFMIDPAFDDATLVDKTTTPPALKFNTLALYGTLYAADPSAPAPQKDRDTKTESVNIAWGYGAGVTTGPDGLGNYKSFKFPFRTVTNGLTQETLVDQDRAICRNSFTIRFWVNSGDPAPSAPLSVQFCNAADQAVVYPVWTSYGDLFGSSGGTIRDRQPIITDNTNAMLAKVAIPVEMFPQRVEVYRSGVGVIASATVSPGNNNANLVINHPDPSGSMVFQIRTYANGYYSTNLPKYLNYWWYYWVKGDTTAPHTFELYPTETFFNNLSGADARPFPSQFSVKAKDTANGSVLSFLEISKTEISFVGATGVLTRDYDIGRMEYGYRYQLDAVPTDPGTYYYKVVLPDASRPTSHTTTALFPFKLDQEAPKPLEINPSDGAVTNSLPSFNAKVGDPELPDGTSGSGPNMDPSRAQITPFKTLGSAVAEATNSLTATVYGIDVVATDHVDKAIPVNTEI